MTSSSVPPPVHTGPAGASWIGRFTRPGSDQEWFLLCDPDSSYRVEPATATVVCARTEAAVGVVTISAAVLGGAWAATLGSAWVWCVVLFVLGAPFGYLLGAALALPLVGVSTLVHRADDRARRRPRSVRVDPGPAWALCELAAGIAELGSWRDSTVDPGRRVAPIAFSAVRRALAAEAREADARTALRHPDLEDLARTTLADLERERAALAEVEANLRAVLAAGQRIDEQRASAERRRVEERDLHERLTRPALPATDPDASVGLAVESETVAELLSDADRIVNSG